jgi:hypothetical protein
VVEEKEDLDFAEARLKERSTKLDNALSVLSDVERDMWKSCYIDKMSYKQLMEKYDMKLSAVKTRISRTTMKLKAELGLEGRNYLKGTKDPRTQKKKSSITTVERNIVMTTRGIFKLYLKNKLVGVYNTLADARAERLLHVKKN